MPLVSLLCTAVKLPQLYGNLPCREAVQRLWDAFGVPGTAYQWEACSVGTPVLPAQGMTFSQCHALFSTPKYRRCQGFIFSKTS